MQKTRLGGWRIARVHGMDLKIHFSLVFLLFYILLIAGIQFPLVLKDSGIDPHLISGTPFLWGCLFALGLFFSIVVHEFAHALVAQSMGVRVEGITLMMLGGISEMERFPETRYAEFKISIVGPLTSFGIAALFYLIQTHSGSPGIQFYSYWLSRLNLVLGIFNLLPAFPLDGGRALRSLLAAKQGVARATQTSVSIAKALAWVLGILGFLSFNFLLMLIAVFIYTASNSELVLSVSRDLLKGVLTRNIAIHVPPIHEQDSLHDATERMFRSRNRILPVETLSHEPAIVTLDSIKRIPRDRWARTMIQEAMIAVPHFLNMDEPIDQEIPDLAKYGALPVRAGDRIEGLVRFSDLMNFVEIKTVSEHSSEVDKNAA